MHCETWRLIGLCALALGAAIVIVAVFPDGLLILLAAALLIFCGVGLLKRRSGGEGNEDRDMEVSESDQRAPVPFVRHPG